MRQLILFLILMAAGIECVSADYVHTNNIYYLDGQKLGDISGNGINFVPTEVVINPLPSGVYTYNFSLTDSQNFYSDGINLTDNFSIEMILNTSNVTSQYDIILQTDYANTGIIYRILSTGKPSCAVCFGDGNFQQFTANTSLSANRWYHIMFTYNGTSAVWYINGTQDIITNYTGAAKPSVDRSLMLYPNGVIGDFRLALLREYSTALTPSQVLQNYNNDIWRVTDTSRIRKTYVTMGDSTTLGYGGNGTSWPLVLNWRIPDHTFINYGINGGSSGNLLAVWDSNVTALHPNRVTIMIGYNDITTGGSLESLESNVSTMVDWSISNGTEPILCTILPSEGIADIATYNTWIKSYAASRGLKIIDFYPILNDPNNDGYLLENMTIDGVHPNAAGYTALANSVPLYIFNDTLNGSEEHDTEFQEAKHEAASTWKTSLPFVALIVLIALFAVLLEVLRTHTISPETLNSVVIPLVVITIIVSAGTGILSSFEGII